MERYPTEFDRLTETWAVIETEHDKQHPDRGMCGGVGGCSMMAAAIDLQHAMIEQLKIWRTRR